MLSPELFPISRKKMYLFFAVLDLVFGTFRYLMTPENGISYHLIWYAISVVNFWIIWELIMLSGRLLEKKFPIASNPYKRVIIQTFFTYVLLIVPALLIRRDVSPVLLIIGYMIYLIMAALLNLIYFGTIYFFNWKRDLVSLANMQREQAIVNYDILRNQLNPHFLFNALTSLNSLIFENQELASDFLQQLSKVYRYTLQNKDKEVVSVRTELDFVSNYIFLLKTRFGDAIDFRIDVDEKTRDRQIVPVITQMLIENAVKHNIVSVSRPLKVSIFNNENFLFIENSLNRKEQVETSNKQGLQNLMILYKYLSENPVEVIESENVFKVKIPLL